MFLHSLAVVLMVFRFGGPASPGVFQEPTFTPTPSPTVTPLPPMSTPTEDLSGFPTVTPSDFSCPSGGLSGLGVVTPSAAWMSLCGQCLPSPTPWATAWISSTEVLSTPTVTPAVTPGGGGGGGSTSTPVPSALTCGVDDYLHCEQVDTYTVRYTYTDVWTGTDFTGHYSSSSTHLYARAIVGGSGSWPGPFGTRCYGCTPSGYPVISNSDGVPMFMFGPSSTFDYTGEVPYVYHVAAPGSWDFDFYTGSYAQTLTLQGNASFHTYTTDFELLLSSLPWGSWAGAPTPTPGPGYCSVVRDSDVGFDGGGSMPSLVSKGPIVGCQNIREIVSTPFFGLLSSLTAAGLNSTDGYLWLLNFTSWVIGIFPNKQLCFQSLAFAKVVVNTVSIDLAYLFALVFASWSLAMLLQR